MENKNKLEVTTERTETKEPIFNFPEIAGLKEGMANLVQKLQANIDNGKYDALVSDEVGGRIPTLILREIIKARRPESKINTYFIASGKTYFPQHGSEDYNKLIQYIRDITEGDNNVLLVTQYVHSGKTLAKLAGALQEAGVSHVDAAVLNSLKEESVLQKHTFGTENVFVGTSDSSTYEFDEHTSWLTGVAKTKDYSPKLKLLQEVIAQEGRGRFISQQEWMEIFDIKKGERYQDFKTRLEDPEKNEKWDARARELLSEAELKELREIIQKAREDVKTLATGVLETVWSK